MPPRIKYTREQILEVAYDMVRKHGMEILTARGLAAELGISTAPIFTAFKNIEEVQDLIIDRAGKLYNEYLMEGLSQELPFKGAGIKYVQFAKDEPEFFKLLFMSDETDVATHFMPTGFEKAELVTETLKKSQNLGDEKAKALYNHLSVYAHGLAVLYAQRRCIFTMEDVSEMLSQVFWALKGEEKL